MEYFINEINAEIVNHEPTEYDYCIDACTDEANESGTPASDDPKWTNAQYYACMDSCDTYRGNQ